MSQMIVHDNFGMKVGSKGEFIHLIYEDLDLKITHVFVIEAGEDHAERYAQEIMEESQKVSGEEPKPQVETFGPQDLKNFRPQDDSNYPGAV